MGTARFNDDFKRDAVEQITKQGYPVAEVPTRELCHDNAVAESFFNLLKRERIRRRTYKTRADARQDCSTKSRCSTIHNANT